MNEPKLWIAGIETPDAEVELSAEDLLGLAAPCNNNERLPEPLVKKAIAPAAPSVAARRSLSTSHVVASGILTLGVIAAAYFAVASSGGGGRLMTQERAPQSQLPASAPASEGEPVRFANPFDPKEVFEFPAGTSEAEARDAVAEMLMERAMERQGKFDARVSDNR
jgi:hypothetical protein